MFLKEVRRLCYRAELVAKGQDCQPFSPYRGITPSARHAADRNTDGIEADIFLESLRHLQKYELYAVPSADPYCRSHLGALLTVVTSRQ
jgi:hypothetical protein